MPDSKPVPPEAVAVLQQFLDAATRKDEPGMRACLNKTTLESGSFSGAGPEGVRFEMGAGAWDGDVVVIPLAGYPIDAPPATPATPPVMTLPCVLVQEEGAWKLDLAAAMERMMGGGGLEAAMNQAVSALGDAMKGMGEALGNAMGQAFGSSAENSTSAAAEQSSPAPAETSNGNASLNDLNFASAVASLKENEGMWASSLEMCFQHPVMLTLDFDSLGGKYERVQPFIGQALTGTIEALSRLAFEPAFKEKVAAIEGVTISGLAGDKSCATELKQGQLSVRVPIKVGDYRPPTPQITAALLAMG